MTGAEKDTINEKETYKLSMVSTRIRIGPIMLKMFIIHFKYMYLTLITFERSNEFVSDEIEKSLLCGQCQRVLLQQSMNLYLSLWQKDKTNANEIIYS